MLIVALLTGRSALIDALLRNGADASATNEKGFSPVLVASQLGNVVAARRLIEAGARINDGSLHQAARSLHLQVVKLLLQDGANPNYRSSVHDGRTPLSELYLNGMATGSASQIVEDIITELRRKGANTEQLIDRKPLICLALDNSDPVPMVKAVMSAYLSEYIDENFNLYEDDKSGMVYSPTFYVMKGPYLGPPAKAQELVQLLKNYGCNRSVYYSLQGPQPAEAKGIPHHIAEKGEGKGRKDS